MTPQEFKAWFDGFTEAVDKQPTQKQWARIKERVAEIDGKMVTEKVYVDRYLPSYINYPPIYVQPYYWRGTLANNITSAAQIGSFNVQNCITSISSDAQSFDSLSAMNALGHADAASLNS